MKSITDIHEFAFYSDDVKNIASKRSNLDIQLLTDPILTHRLISIVRIDKGETLVIFNSQFNILCTVFDIRNKTIAIEINEINTNTQLNPHISWVLPVLKKEAFEEALYVLTAMGVQEIQPILTAKTHKTYNNKDQERNRKIMIAAAEQSKQFIIPNILPIIHFELWILSNNNSTKIFLDSAGSSLQSVIDKIKQNNAQKLTVISGPEADLTLHEKEQLKNNGFIFCALTKSILKAEQAITVGLGAFRSLL